MSLAVRQTTGAGPGHPSQFSNANFRVRVTSASSSTSRDFDIDWVGVKVTVSGSGGSVPVPDIAVAPTSYNFGARPVGSTVIQGFTVSNTGNDDLSHREFDFDRT